MERGRSVQPKQALFFALGCLSLLLGLIGVVVPLMPTTVFLIFAAWCFGRSSPRFESWMLDHPIFGPALHGWRERGAIPRRAKVMACVGISAGYALFLFSVRPQMWLVLSVAAFLLATATWILTRPE